MIYDHLTPREQQVLDLLMSREITRPRETQIAEKLGTSVRNVKNILHVIVGKYHISYDRFLPSVRLVYLRSKELGLL